MKKMYVLTVLMLSFLVGFSQTASGVVSDENGDPLFGVSVIEKGTFNGTTTDFDGKYTLNLTTDNPVLVFKFVGYRDHEIAYTGGNVNHKMKVDEIGLDAVVVSASKRKERVLDAPASVTLINTQKIENTAAVVAVDNLKSVPGVDIMPTGLVSQNVSVRGFNNIFSGSMLTIVDNRFAGVPSLKVNAFQLMPTSNDDIEKIEIVRGPGSALYGPNAADGVLQIITKSPLAMDDDHNAETTISFLGGSRSIWSPNVRHAQKVNDKFGFKISGGYMQGHDFEYYDDREPTYGDTYWLFDLRDGVDEVFDSTAGPQEAGRDFFIQKYNFDARFDVALNKDIDFTFSSGYANTSNLELTGLGAAQSDGWGYTYGQFRARWKNLFLNYFINASNSGNTFIIPEKAGQEDPFKYQRLTDLSKFHGIQIQHNSKIKEKLDLTYGADFLLTRPISNASIYGRYEDEDNINQYGIYGQAEWHVNDKVDIVAALRGDYQDVIQEFMFSPRAAFVYKPTPRHTTRITYNRAFSAPSALNTALDLPRAFVPNGIIARGLGNPSGFNYNYGSDGLAQFINPYDGTWNSVNDPSNNALYFGGVIDALGVVVAQGIYGGNPTQAQLQFVQDELQVLIGDLDDPTSSVLNSSVGHQVLDFVTNEEYDYTQIQDLESVKSTVTQTVELGYKGIIKDKLFLSADLYYTQINNYVSPLSPASYKVQFNPNELAAAIAPTVEANYASGNVNGIVQAALNSVITSSGLNNVTELLVGAASNIAIGTVAPESDKVNSDWILTYINLGKVDVAGADLGFTYKEKFKDTDVSFSGMFSFVNKDRIPLAGASGGYVALNAPKYKTAFAVESFNIANTGLGAGINWRWQDAFPANSAIYVGDVNAANLIDLSVSYRPNFSKNTLITGNFYNIANYKFQRFPGTPAIGFYAMLKVSHTFKYTIGKNKNNAE